RGRGVGPRGGRGRGKGTSSQGKGESAAIAPPLVPEQGGAPGRRRPAGPQKNGGELFPACGPVPAALQHAVFAQPGALFKGNSGGAGPHGEGDCSGPQLGATSNQNALRFVPNPGAPARPPRPFR